MTSGGRRKIATTAKTNPSTLPVPFSLTGISEGYPSWSGSVADVNPTPAEKAWAEWSDPDGYDGFTQYEGPTAKDLVTAGYSWARSNPPDDGS